MAVRQKISPYKAEDLLRPGAPEKFVEIVYGELIVSEPAGKYHNRIAYKFIILLSNHCRDNKDLDYGGDNDGFLLRRDPDVLYSPDAALFYKRPDSSADYPWQEFCPELLIEVVSPSNTLKNMVRKRHDYFEAGAEQVWLVYPDRKTIEVHFSDGKQVVVGEKDMLTGEGIAEGLTINVAELFVY